MTEFIKYFKTFKPAQSNAEQVLRVNNHLHTPFSFSAFDKVSDALDQSMEEGVKVVGVNDFFSFDAYPEWCKGAFERNLFPLFNVEFIGLNEKFQKEGLKINDPGNPGRTYFSGKGLAYPLVLSDATQRKIASLVEDANEYVRQMTDKVNDLIASKRFGFRLDFEAIKSQLTEGQVRERHLARAIRILAEKHYKDPNRLFNFYRELLDTSVLNSKLSDEAGVENEIRNALLKAGKAAYVAEEPDGFLKVEDIRDIIIEAGGIPTYPFLADAVKGYTDFERGKSKVSTLLKEMGVWSVEFIPTRNELSVLKDYAKYLYNEGFIVTFGTEHNSPGKQPIEVMAKGGEKLDDELMTINFEGTCIIAAHQFLFAKDGQGVLNGEGVFSAEMREEYAQLGRELIRFITT